MLDNQMLLLLVLGFAIYYLTCSSGQQVDVKTSVEAPSPALEGVLENFAEEEMPEEEMPEEEMPEEEMPEALAEAIVEEEEEEEEPAVVEATQELETAASMEEANAPIIEETSSDPNGNVASAEEAHNSADFLPVEKNDSWFESNVAMELDDTALINVKSGYHIGVNTVGQSLRNASHDIRGTISNPKSVVSPWMNSTIEPDNNLKSLC